MLRLVQNLSQFPNYWKVRAKYLKLKFYLSRFNYGTLIKLKGYWKFVQSLTLMLRSSISYYLLPLIIAVILQTLEPETTKLLKNLGINLTIRNGSDYVTLLGVIIGLGGVFIGLYYAAITSISGAIYARVPQNLRDLLLQERLGNAYMRFLAMFTAFGIILFAFYIFNFKPNPLNLVIIAASSCFSVFAFFQLGMRAFSLFDPTSLAQETIIKIEHSINNVMIGSPHAKVAEIQSYEYRQAKENINTLTVLAGIAEQERHLNGKVYINFCKNLIQHLCWYEYAKSKINSESNWFATEYSFPDWYRTADYLTKISAKTAHLLQPNKVKNYQWLENEILEIILNCLRINLRSNEFSLVQEMLSSIEKYIVHCSSLGRIKNAINLLNRVSSVIEHEMVKLLKLKKSVPSMELLAITNIIAAIPATIYLYYLHSLKTRSGQSLTRNLNSMDWKNVDSIYKLDLYLDRLPIQKIEWLQKTIAFEFEAVGDRITPNWYINNFICKGEADKFYSDIDNLTDSITSLFDKWIKGSAFSKQFLITATCITCEKQFWNKITHQIDALESYWLSLSEYRVHDNSWPMFYINKINEKSESRLAELDIISAEIVIELLSIDRPESYPDFAGQFLHSHGEALFTSMIRGDYERFSKLFHNYFIASFMQFNKLMPKDLSEQWRVESQINIASSPIIDLIDLSGYCILMSEYLDNKNFSRLVHAYWKNYFNSAQDNSRVKSMTATLVLFDSARMLPHRGEYRFIWQRSIYEKLGNEVPKKTIYPHGMFSEYEMVLHSNVLVRIFAEDKVYSDNNGIDIFAVFILRPNLPDESIIEINRYNRFADELKLNIKNYNEYKDAQ